MENNIPEVPYGYYVAICPDPEGGCGGWHLYRDPRSVVCAAPLDELERPAHLVTALGGFCWPTGGHYCDGGAPLTQAWVRGLVQPAYFSMGEKYPQDQIVYPAVPHPDDSTANLTEESAY